jgi:hypothetical protein
MPTERVPTGTDLVATMGSSYFSLRVLVPRGGRS